MAAGQGFKTFATGDVLSASDVNGYLMQGVLVFADATERNAEITSPQEGQFAYLKDTNVTTYYTGSAWANLDTTGMTNPMTTTGDTIYSSSGSTPARLGIGSTGQVLTVAGGVPSWAAPAGGGATVLVNRTSFSSVASQTFDSVFSSTYKNYTIVVEKFVAATASDDFQLIMRYGTTDSTNHYSLVNYYVFNSASLQQVSVSGGTQMVLSADSGSGNFPVTYQLQVANIGSGNAYPLVSGVGYSINGSHSLWFGGYSYENQTYTGFKVKSSSSNVTGTISVYGWKDA